MFSLFPSAFVIICYKCCIPAQLCNSHGCLGSTWVTSHPKGDDPCFTERGGGGKVLLQIQWPCSSLTMYFLMACWGHTRWLTLFLRNKNGQISLERACDSALTEQHQTAELCLILAVLTMLWLVSISWSKERCKAKRSKWNREKVLPLPVKSHPKQFIWDQKGHIAE